MKQVLKTPCGVYVARAKAVWVGAVYLWAEVERIYLGQGQTPQLVAVSTISLQGAESATAEVAGTSMAAPSEWGNQRIAAVLLEGK